MESYDTGKSYGSRRKTFKSFDSHTAASIFFVIFVVRLIVAMLNNLVMEWCDQMDTAVTRGIEWTHTQPNQGKGSMAFSPATHVFTSTSVSGGASM
ncbi:hypothetical protein SARC_04839 [Sphaeroforma arctica JP610]|uniref:Uncharacterized protein n=1 Tax=Sphaeroforma arctica JP610 TaxID=667725 RepID=A0A0L0G241_9EUKA|nr:hypothetical protein SARC_04839 [Sphaeroforma arctica JP610]KNC82896.1 hypothetical protein SARC_04839 [Sphaeroforma arctica JP610]|eukprot:XP_014156798.1 hypothetical protein SARC_04839 [Sphaeroforma arctica JP610]